MLTPIILWSLMFVWLSIILISSYRFIDIAGREFIKLLVVTEDDDSDIDRAQHRQLVRFLEQAAFTLEKSY